MGKSRNGATGKIVPVSARREAERALLIGAAVKGRGGGWPLDDSLRELHALAVSAGANVVGTARQLVERMTPYYMGKGKLEDTQRIVRDRNVSTVILDDELTPTQQRNLEDAYKVKVVDRTALILDIFAQRAQTREGRLQVDLAQHEYLLPRMRGQWSHLERLGGGIGTRGPGESQLETDRRLVRNRIHRLKEQLDEVRRRRAQHRETRRERGLHTVSLIGYTNAGKSTLMNALTHSDVMAADKLFATLDPVTRNLRLPSGGEALLTDTVGFIHKLPHTLVAAFRATLEEIHEADLLLHVADAHDRNAQLHYRAVVELLEELDAADKPRILVLGKMDLVGPEPPDHYRRWLDATLRDDPTIRAIPVSAVAKQGLDDLKTAIGEALGIRPRLAGAVPAR